jgi:hypothetical protein
MGDFALNQAASVWSSATQIFDEAVNLRYIAFVTSRDNRLLALSFGTVFIVFAQTVFCFLEHIPLFEPLVGIEDSQSADSPDDPDGPHCCQAHPDDLLAASAGFSLGSLLGQMSASPDANVLDGPVRKIEHPPQLS